MGLFSKKLSSLKTSLDKTSSRLSNNIKNVFTKKYLDEEILEELEEILISNDFGVHFASEFVADFAKDKFDKDISAEKTKSLLQEKIYNYLKPFEKEISLNQNPTVIMVAGVNGNGKTTTIGKLAHNYSKSGKKVLIAACDTFRAAAKEQLNSWVKNANADIYMGKEGQDPASVTYEAFIKTKEENYDILIIDTAGRLHNNKNLMNELKKIETVIKKIDENAPHYSFLVLDANTGQNALTQTEIFVNTININGLIITKLDGTAKAGIIVAITDKFKIPLYYIGVGEKQEDLRVFKAKGFAQNLL